MKIMILANNDVGLYKFRKELLQELINQNHDVYICLPYGEYVDELKKIGCIFLNCNLLNRHGVNPIQEVKLISFYKVILKQYNPDIVFTYTIKPNIYGGYVCSKFRIPYVVNITGLGTAVENPGLMQKITLFLYKKGLKNAQKVYFQNVENRDFMLKRGLINGPYDILPGSGVNLEQYKLLPYPKEKTINFMFISRIMKEKGIDQYLDAAEFIKKKYPMTRFHVCGFCEQEYENKLKKLENEGIIIYHGLVDNIEEMHRISSCTVHPTYYPEGLSNVLLESCACGRPIITTNRSGCREIVDDEINGFVVREKDSQDLIRKIEKFLNISWERRKEMGLEGRRKVEKKFDREIVINRYLGELK